MPGFVGMIRFANGLILGTEQPSGLVTLMEVEEPQYADLSNSYTVQRPAGTRGVLQRPAGSLGLAVALRGREDAWHGRQAWRQPVVHRPGQPGPQRLRRAGDESPGSGRRVAGGRRFRRELPGRAGCGTAV